MLNSYDVVVQDFQSIIDFLRFGISRANAAGLYYGHGTDNVSDDMLALILGSLSLPPDVDPIVLHARLTRDEKVGLCQQLKRRIMDRVPVAYLIKQAYFCELPFYVDERVIIPRSPIAELIRQEFSPWIAADAVERVLDLCTGSGCIAIACCYAFPGAEVDAVDISPDALAVAEINRQRHDLQNVLRLIESDAFENVPVLPYDIIVSNPPYVGHEEMQTLPEEYRHEPNLALEATHHGLAVVDKILMGAHAYLSDHGILVVEVGHSEEALLEAYPNIPFTWLDFESGGQGVFVVTRQQLKEHFAP